MPKFGYPCNNIYKEDSTDDDNLLLYPHYSGRTLIKSVLHEAGVQLVNTSGVQLIVVVSHCVLIIVSLRCVTTYKYC